jgi:general secretion pathway protein G
MPETNLHCQHCGAALVPGRSSCLACLAPIAVASRAPAGQVAELARQIPSTHRPDKTLVFVPAHREARLKRARRLRRGWLAALAACLLLALTGLVVWREQAHKQAQAQQQRRAALARRELDLYAKALETFYADFGRYPSLKEGVAALVRKPAALSGWRGPYIEGDYAVDPWGNEYVYRVWRDGAGYELFTHGPEGETAKRVFLSVHAGVAEPAATP